MRYVFGDCVFDTERYVLHRAGQPIRLRPKVFQVLIYLLAHRERVITKQELSEQVWHGRFISDATLESTLAAVRRGLEEVGMTPDEEAPYLLQFLEVPGELDLTATHRPQAIRARTSAILVQLALQGARRRPLVLEVENLHWIDPSSEEVLAGLGAGHTGPGGGGPGADAPGASGRPGYWVEVVAAVPAGPAG
jgi:Transcriptional regulatory protein, C terminal